MPKLDQIWAKYAGTCGILDRRPSFRFDPDFYGSRHPALAGDVAALERHYRDYGSAAGYIPNYYQDVRNYDSRIDDVLAELVIEPDLRDLMLAGEPGSPELAFELIHLGAPVDAQISDFSMTAYLDLHPDIAQVQVDPLMHYLCHGRNEIGRRTLRDIRESHYSGPRSFIPGRPTCLLAIHEMSRTGAPMVARDLAREAARDHNVIVASLRGGQLLDDFRAVACDVVITERPLEDFRYFAGEAFGKIDFAIINSVVGVPFVPLLVARDIPFAAYIHEYAYYIFPVQASRDLGLFSDLLVFSSDHVRDSWSGRLADITFDMARDSAVVPQRPLSFRSVSPDDVAAARRRLSELLGRDLSAARLICGAGHLQWRKGTDIFAMTAQICRSRDPDAVFVWIGDGLDFEDVHFGVWMHHHMGRIGANVPGGTLHFLPAGKAYPDVLAAADAMFMSSRSDPLPNVVFDAMAKGCRVVLFDGGSGFGDPVYRSLDAITAVEYGNPEAAAAELLSLPRKAIRAVDGPEREIGRLPEGVFARLRGDLQARLAAHRYFVRGASEIDEPVLYTRHDRDRPLRIREREKMMRLGRRLVWRDTDEVAAMLERSGNWVHRHCRLAPHATVPTPVAPQDFGVHIHARTTDDLTGELRSRMLYRLAARLVITADTDKKRDEVERIAHRAGIPADCRLVADRGRDVLPFLDLIRSDSELPGIWCHLTLQRPAGATEAEQRRALDLVLGGEGEVSEAMTRICEPEVGLVAALDPWFGAWNGARALLPRFADRLPGPMPQNPLVYPRSGVFWVKRSVVEAVSALFGPDYPWPNEPIPFDGTEIHLIERLWPAMAAGCGLDSVFLHGATARTS